MKLMKLKLLSDYKFLKAGTEWEFSNNDIIVITGTNGSGKSQLLELIQKCFDKIHKINTNQNCDEKLFFQIKYMINFDVFEIIVERYEWKRYKNDYAYDPFINKFDIFLPNIISSSSGGNEVLSASYYKNQILHINNSLEKYDYYNLMNEGIVRFLDITNRKIYLLTLYIFNHDVICRELEKLIGIYEIQEFSFQFKAPRDRSGNEIFILEKYKVGIDIILKSAKFQENGTYYFDIDSINTLRNKFASSRYFFETLIYLETLNYYSFNKNQVLNLISLKDENIKEVLERNYRNDYFYIDSINFENNISYRNISDGEMQLAQIFGMISVYFVNHYSESAIFLLDEPDTHLNVRWKEKYIKMLNQVLNNNNNNNAQIILTTHNSEIISELESQDILLLNKGKSENVEISTFGNTLSTINSKLFGKKYNISEIAVDLYKRYLNEIRREPLENLPKIKEAIYLNMADSPEKTNLLLEIKRKERKR